MSLPIPVLFTLFFDMFYVIMKVREACLLCFFEQNLFAISYISYQNIKNFASVVTTFGLNETYLLLYFKPMWYYIRYFDWVLQLHNFKLSCTRSRHLLLLLFTETAHFAGSHKFFSLIYIFTVFHICSDMPETPINYDHLRKLVICSFVFVGSAGVFKGFIPEQHWCFF